jgi:tRNA pseudouridine38-40 synthase
MTPPARVLRATLEYDGTDFHGWARQPGRRSVEGVLREAIRQLEGQAPVLSVAGRTDAGVHATGQAVSWKGRGSRPVEEVRHALDALTPDDLSVLEVAEAPPGFDARRSALCRRYAYLLQSGPPHSALARRYSWALSGRLRVSRMAAAAELVVGEHDFSAFAVHEPGSAGTREGGLEWGPRGARRTVTLCRVTAPRRAPAASFWLGARAAGWVLVEVVADAFLYRMVRSLVGTLVEVGRGARDPARMEDLLRGGSRAEAGATAPARGLTLVGVDYPGLDELPPRTRLAAANRGAT